MRGSELLTATPERLDGLFLIPMRGSESTAHAVVGIDVRSAWFLIPMRGSEGDVWEGMSANLAFLIPMRGSEKDNWHRANKVVIPSANVPDPHEG